VDSEIAKAFGKERTLTKQHGKKVVALIPLDLDGYLIQWGTEKRMKSVGVWRLTSEAGNGTTQNLTPKSGT